MQLRISKARIAAALATIVIVAAGAVTLVATQSPRPAHATAQVAHRRQRNTVTRSFHILNATTYNLKLAAVDNGDQIDGGNPPADLPPRYTQDVEVIYNFLKDTEVTLTYTDPAGHAWSVKMKVDAWGTATSTADSDNVSIDGNTAIGLDCPYPGNICRPETGAAA